MSNIYELMSFFRQEELFCFRLVIVCSWDFCARCILIVGMGLAVLSV